MSYNTSTRVSTTDQAIAGLLAAGVMFILGYTVVRTSLAHTAIQQGIETTSEADVTVTVPGEGTLWADFGTSF